MAASTTRSPLLPLPLAALVLAFGCGQSSGSAPSSDGGSVNGGSSGSGGSSGAVTDDSGAPGVLPDGGVHSWEGGAGCAGGVLGFSRPAQVFTPSTYDCKSPTPVVILLHDEGSTGDLEETYFGLQAQAEARGFLYIHPDGTRNATGDQVWNATDACCGGSVDDSIYLSNLLYQLVEQYNVDPKRVYVIGHGNGGFMAYRLACDHSTQVTAVVSLGGSTWSSAGHCSLLAPTSALEIHGTDDTVFAYDGGIHLDAAYPSAPQTVSDWLVADDECASLSTAGPPLDLDSTLPGAETTVTEWNDCPLSTSAALWSIQGGAHSPTLSPTFLASTLGFLFDQVKP